MDIFLLTFAILYLIKCEIYLNGITSHLSTMTIKHKITITLIDKKGAQCYRQYNFYNQVLSMCLIHKDLSNLNIAKKVNQMRRLFWNLFLYVNFTSILRVVNNKKMALKAVIVL